MLNKDSKSEEQSAKIDSSMKQKRKSIVIKMPGNRCSLVPPGGLELRESDDHYDSLSEGEKGKENFEKEGRKENFEIGGKENFEKEMQEMGKNPRKSSFAPKRKRDTLFNLFRREKDISSNNDVHFGEKTQPLLQGEDDNPVISDYNSQPMKELVFQEMHSADFIDVEEGENRHKLEIANRKSMSTGGLKLNKENKKKVEFSSQTSSTTISSRATISPTDLGDEVISMSGVVVDENVSDGGKSRKGEMKKENEKLLKGENLLKERGKRKEKSKTGFLFMRRNCSDEVLEDELEYEDFENDEETQLRGYIEDESDINLEEEEDENQNKNKNKKTKKQKKQKRTEKKPYPKWLKCFRLNMFKGWLVLVFTVTIIYLFFLFIVIEKCQFSSQFLDQVKYSSIPAVSILFTWWHVWLGMKMCFYPVEFKGCWKPYLGWQGIIPRRAGVMAERSCDLMVMSFFSFFSFFFFFLKKNNFFHLLHKIKKDR